MGKIVDLWKGNTIKNTNGYFADTTVTIIKASQGTTKDTKADAFIEECSRRGKPFWMYVYLSKGNPTRQLEYFTRVFNDVLRNNENIIGFFADVEDGQDSDEALEIAKYIVSIGNFYQLKFGIYTGYKDFDKYEKAINHVRMYNNGCHWEARYTDKYKPHDTCDLWQNYGDITIPTVYGTVDTSVCHKKGIKFFTSRRQVVKAEDLLAEHLVNTAIGQCGYKEKKSNSKLFTNTGNVGDANYTKYGQWLGYNGDYWCASFVSYCFARAFGHYYGKKVLGTYSPACNGLKAKMEIVKTPKVGDVVFFSGTRHVGANHVGIVRKVDSEYIYTVEGNANPTGGVTDNGGMVCQKSYKRSNNRIIGYGRPKYTIINCDAYTGELPTKYPSKGYYYNGCDKSEYVEQIQSFLLWYFDKKGMKCETKVNGVYKDLTEGYVKKFQELMGLTPNGCWGKLCYEKAKNVSFKRVVINPYI